MGALRTHRNPHNRAKAHPPTTSKSSNSYTTECLHKLNEINRLKDENKQLEEKISKNYLKDILSAVSQIQQAQQEKKSKNAKTRRRHCLD